MKPIVAIILIFSFFGIVSNTALCADTPSKANVQQKSDDIEKLKQEVLKLNIKLAESKSDAYEKALNELKYYIIGFGIILYISLSIFGLIKHNEVKDIKDEFRGVDKNVREDVTLIKNEFKDFEKKLRDEIITRLTLEVSALQGKIFETIDKRVADNVITPLDSTIDAKIADRLLHTIEKTVEEVIEANFRRREGVVSQAAKEEVTLDAPVPTKANDDPFAGGENHE